MIGHVMKEGQRVEIPLAEFRGYMVREGTYDAFVVKELKSYSWMDVKDRSVLDIGANIGVFTKWAMDQGAKRVAAYEPEGCNFELLEINAPGAIHRKDAIVSKSTGSAMLYISPTGKNPGNSSLVPSFGRSAHVITTVAFKDVLAEHKPEVIKVDCEGAEYDFFMKPLPKYVKQVTIELHLTKRGNHDQARALMANFEGWECVKAPKLTGSNWHTIGAWRR